MTTLVVKFCPIRTEVNGTGSLRCHHRIFVPVKGSGPNSLSATVLKATATSTESYSKLRIMRSLSPLIVSLLLFLKKIFLAKYITNYKEVKEDRHKFRQKEKPTKSAG